MQQTTEKPIGVLTLPARHASLWQAGKGRTSHLAHKRSAWEKSWYGKRTHAFLHPQNSWDSFCGRERTALVTNNFLVATRKFLRPRLGDLRYCGGLRASVFQVLSRSYKTKIPIASQQELMFCGRERSLESYRFCTPIGFFVSLHSQKILNRASSPLAESVPTLSSTHKIRGAHFVGGRGLEPPCLAALAPKASVSAISPPARFFSGCSLSSVALRLGQVKNFAPQSF